MWKKDAGGKIEIYGKQTKRIIVEEPIPSGLFMDAGKGYADRVYIPRPQYADKPVLIIELKYEKDADGAISQIKRQEYPDRLEAYKGNILLVRINYNKDTKNTSPDFKHHTCEIDRV